MAKRVFFSFHYQDVIDFRANVVRQSWVTKADRESAGFFDASLWESSRRVGDANIRKLIDDGLNGTSVTAVLIGSDTYNRRWVRYEILKSLSRGNKLVGIHINKIRCRNSQTKSHGQNPFDHVGLYFNDKGDYVSPCEHNGAQWAYHTDVKGWSLSKPLPQHAGKVLALSTWYKSYCWVDHDGYGNLGTWVE